MQLFGDIAVECVEEEDESSYERRVFKVCKGDEERHIVQFQYTDWVSLAYIDFPTRQNAPPGSHFVRAARPLTPLSLSFGI